MRFLGICSVAALVLLAAAGTGSSAPRAHHVRNGLIVFSSYRAYDENGAQIYTITAAGKRARRLTRTPANDTTPQWSPDGRSIAFTRTPDLTAPSSIWVMTATGKNLKQVTPPGMNAYGPSWAPDGKRLAFSGEHGLAILDLATGKVRDVPGGGGGAWSPNGRRIAFVDGYQIYTIRPDGTGLTRITKNRADYGSLSWSPDGTRLVTTIPGPTLGPKVPNLVIVKLNGARKVLRAPANAVNPEWSPDGKRIAFSADPIVREGDYDIYAINVTSGNVRDVTTDSLGSDYPDWQPLR
jgi:Tol biopolymer transport system component